MLKKTVIFLSGAFVCLFLSVLLLHVVFIGGIYAYKVMHARQAEKPAPQTYVALAEAGGEAQIYTVRAGDNADSIARAFGISAKDLMRLNHLAPAKGVTVGTVLNVPRSKKHDTEIVRL